MREILLLLVAISGAGVAWFYGYAKGVRDTEERWSEAVARKEARDASGGPR